MKKKDLIKRLKKEGCSLLRHGANHDIWINSETKVKEPVPRHNEIDEFLAKKIIKNLSK